MGMSRWEQVGGDANQACLFRMKLCKINDRVINNFYFFVISVIYNFLIYLYIML